MKVRTSTYCPVTVMSFLLTSVVVVDRGGSGSDGGAVVSRRG